MLNEAEQTSRGPEFINPYGIQSMMRLSMPFESAVRGLGQVIQSRPSMPVVNFSLSIDGNFLTTLRFRPLQTILTTLVPRLLCIVNLSEGTSDRRLAISERTNWRLPDGAVVPQAHCNRARIHVTVPAFYNQRMAWPDSSR